MKKFLTFIFALCAVFVFAGCNGNDNGKGNDGEVSDGGVVLAVAFTVKDGYLTITDTTSVKDYMDALQANGELVFEGTDGDYGFFLTSVYGKTSKTVSSTANSYAGYDWALYTTITTIDGVIYSSNDTFQYNGVTLYKASYGVSGVPCVAGESYALVYEYSEMSW